MPTDGDTTPSARSPVSPTSAPALSVILPVPVRYGLVRRTIQHLRAQTIRHRLEILLIAPKGRAADVIQEELEVFADARVIEVESGATITTCRCAGVREARSPIIVFCEDHSFPVPHWAEALVRRHQSGYAAVAPAFVNGNPGILSGADIFLSFGTWVAPLKGGEMPRLPWHNAAYKRDLLLAYGDRLPFTLEVETVLQDDLRAQGHRLYLETDVQTHHVNFSRILPFLDEYYVSGRLFGGRRADAKQWSLLRRLVYVIGAPLIPIVRLPEVLGQMRRSGHSRTLLPRAIPFVLLGLLAHSIGEMIGYALGTGDAGVRKSLKEFDRARFVKASDVQVLAP
ncbi:MAG TPA: glycosyltransferase [Gemmatimonadaceae bacterium]|nr:glycosyltransferase [Gemmatimonadaceae bacterium]